MPANTAALLNQADAGAELACRAQEWAFPLGATTVPRGVISYYAGLTLPKATDLHSWQQAIEQRSAADITNGLITPFYRLRLQIVGNLDGPLPGRPERES